MTEGLAFHCLSQQAFDTVFHAIDMAYVHRDELQVERDRMQAFIEKRDMLGDYQREVQFGESE